MKLIRNILLYAICLFFALEFVLFSLNIPKDYKPHSDPERFWKYNDSEISYVNLKSTSIDFIYDRNPRGYFHYDNAVQHKTNSAGYRGPEIIPHKPEDNYRVFFLGDSSTFGEGVYFEDTYPEQFKKIAKDKGIFGEKVIETINLGVGGYDTPEEYTTLKVAQKAGLDPDRIFVQYALNDPEGGLLKWGGEDEKKVVRNQSSLELFIYSKQKINLILKYSRIFRIVRNWYAGKEISAETERYYHSLYDDSNENWINVKDSIKEFGEYQKETGKPVTFILFPLLYNLKNYPFVNEEKKVEDELSKNGIAFVNLRNYLSNYIGPELWVHPTDQHPNEIVNRIAAQALVDKISNK